MGFIASRRSDPPLARRSRSILVIGLGRFGGAVAEALVGRGYEVLAVDSDPERVQTFSTKLMDVFEADSTNEAALERLGAREFDKAVVAIGTDIKASILTTSSLSDLGVEDIWARAVSEAHAGILTRVGAGHVVFPEKDMGKQLARLVSGKMID